MTLSFFRKLIPLILVSFILVGCSYKPSSYYAKKEINGNVYVSLDVDLENPKNSILMKDALNDLLIQKLDANIVSNKSNANILMNIKLNSASLNVLQYDSLGYNKVFKTTVSLLISYKKVKENMNRSFTVSGEDTFSIEDGTVINDTKKYDSIKAASDNALKDIFSKIAIQSFKE